MTKRRHVTPAMNPDPTKNRHVNPEMNQFSILPYILLVTVIVLGLTIFLYSYNTNSTNLIDDVEIETDIERLA